MRTAWLGWTVVVSALGACADSGSSAIDGGDDASGGGGVVVQEDAGASAPADAGPLWQSCNTGVPASCPSGLECLGVHTTPVDAYARCVFTCAGNDEPLCAVSGGVCACPLPPGSVTGPPGDCSTGNDAGAVTVCVPAGDAGASGNNEVEDAGEIASDAGIADAGGPG
jgi:hypothetical protein